LPLEHDDLHHAIRQPLNDTKGTVVLWERLDRILGYKHPYGEAARKRLSHMCREIELHLGMVFHRFLTSEASSRRFRLLVNGNLVKPWDPFCRSEAKTKALGPITIPVDYEGVSGNVLLEPFILPHQTDFSSPDAFRAASGPANWNQQQGFYIYRAGRMIQSGGWSNLRAPDEHTKLARIAVSFYPALDDAFKINVAKMRVQLPSVIRDSVREAIAPIVKLAREIYDRKAPRSLTAHPRPGGGVVRDLAPPTYELGGQGIGITEERLTHREWSMRVLENCTAAERPIVEAVLKRELRDGTH
jgi:hypothetical protein